ncbi:hypothetical protein AVEN_54563-1 [Araneus ventricosus]|uniref:Uncharacterized protein n=1 Tax=Araneus ventricosus TaxID=182803 RepID=A0A4Y2BLT7_ARAVE|nr:hypothetical protein AVEN_54563-1 [Araneus ventricosus]
MVCVFWCCMRLCRSYNVLFSTRKCEDLLLHDSFPTGGTTSTCMRSHWLSKLVTTSLVGIVNDGTYGRGRPCPMMAVKSPTLSSQLLQRSFVSSKAT